MLTSDNWSIGRRDIFFALMLFAIVFTVHMLLTLRLHSLGVFDQWNVMFDADPNAESKILAHGWSLGEFNHPLLPYFVSLPFRSLSGIAAKLGLASDQEMLRENLVLGVPAFFSAIKAICIYWAFRILRMPRADAVLATLIAALSFSSLLFGSTPSSYALSGAAIALVTLSSVAASQRSTYHRKGSFSISAFFAIGTTVSNVIHCGWMLWANYASDGCRYARAMARAILVAGLFLLLTLLLSWILGLAREGGVNPQRLMLSDEFVSKYKPSHMAQLENASRFPEMLARAYIPTMPLLKPNTLALKNDDPIKFELSFNGSEFGPGSFALWVFGALVLLGGVIVAKMGGMWRLFGFASAASILTTGGLFSWFGINTFLYSQYWQVPAAMLVGAWVYFLSNKVKYGRALVILLAISLASGQIYVLGKIDAALVASSTSSES